MPMDNAARAIRPHVALVDADGSVQDSVRMLGDVLGFDVTAYGTAEEFLAVVDGAHGHIVCAAELPNLDGIALFRALLRRGNRLPFALLISRDNATLRRAARAAGIDAIIEKPRADNALLAFLAEPQTVPV
jgi:FixJ family two-component response regulator